MDYDVDDDEVDAETEAMLYAQIYHYPLDFWDNEILLKIPPDRNEFQKNSTINDSNSIPFTPPKDSLVSRKRNDSENLEIICKTAEEKPAPVVWLSSDDDENSLNSFTSSSSFSDPFVGEPFSSNFETNLDLHINSFKQNSCTQNLPPTTSFESITELLENFTVAQIQSCLPSDKESWPILEEDLCGTSKHSKRDSYRYYRSIRCKRCGEEGHRAKECKTPFIRACFICGNEHHTGWKCKQKTCLLCFTFGHFSEYCKAGEKKRRRFDNVVCTRCTFRGHLSKDCSDIWRQFHSTVGKKNRLQTLKRHNENRLRLSDQIFCYNCGRSGHFGAFCRRSTFMENGMTCFNPTVSYYDVGPAISNIEKMIDNKEESVEMPYVPKIERKRNEIVAKEKERNLKKTKWKKFVNKKARKKAAASKISHANSLNPSKFIDMEDVNLRLKKRKNLNDVGRENFNNLLKTKKKKKKDKNLPKPSDVVERLSKKRKIKVKLRSKKNTEQKFVSPLKRRKINVGGSKNRQGTYSWEDFAVNNVYNGLAQTSNNVKNNNNRGGKRAKHNNFIHDGGKFSWDLPMDGRTNGWLT